VYDMYPWNHPAQASPPARPARPGPARPAGTSRTADVTRALQVALDRRDNGGESAATTGQ
jgi:hypothetical protein